MPSRRTFLTRAAAGAAVGLVAEGALAAEMPLAGKHRVPMPVQYEGAWLTWVGAVTGCLKALGVDCDVIDVAGLSGHAFILNIRGDNLVSGPTAFDHGLLLPGLRRLGRATLSFQGEWHGDIPIDQARDQFRGAYEQVASEVAAGRPCVIWGTYLPEYGIADGFEDGSYLVKTFHRFTNEPEPPIPYDQLQAPGGPYVLAFPCSIPAIADVDRFAVTQAVHLLRQPSHPMQEGGQAVEYAFGLAAYEAWMAVLDGADLEPFGHTYSVHCFADAQSLARQFLDRVANRNDAVTGELVVAGEAYEKVIAAFAELQRLFPWPPAEQPPDAKHRATASGLLAAALEVHTTAVEAMEAALAKEWT